MAEPVASASSPDRRLAQRKRDTVAEIEEHALAIMAVDGVAGLTIAAIARRMGIKPPSVYKHVDSLMDVHDRLFRRGQAENLAALERAMADGPRGLPAVRAGLEATARWAAANQVLAQLLFWRPVPGYVPSAQAIAPAEQIVSILQRELRDAVADGQLAHGAASVDGMALLSAMHFGAISQHLANEPGVAWGRSRYARAHRRTVEIFAMAYPVGVDPR